MMPEFDFSLGETADAIRETTRRFAADRIAPIAASVDAANSFPRDLIGRRQAASLTRMSGGNGFVASL